MRTAAERGSGAAGAAAGALVGPLLQNLVLSVGDNEELCYCLKAWQVLPRALRRGGYPSKEDALKVRGQPLVIASWQVTATQLTHRNLDALQRAEQSEWPDVAVPRCGLRTGGCLLQASAVVDRIRRAIAATSDSVSSRIGPIATSFGKAFGVDDWYAGSYLEPCGLKPSPADMHM